MKRLSILLLSALCTAATTFAYDFQSGDLYYYITGENTVEVTCHTGIGYWTDLYVGFTTISIPASVTYDGITYSVTGIGYETFRQCTALTSITIPNSVTRIGGDAFRGCSSLTSITIPNSVTSIGDMAFSGCSSLTSIVIESGNTVYDSRDNCNAIIETATNTLIAGCQTTIIPNSVTSIGYEAFYGRSSLTSITIPNSVTSIGNHAFSGCSSLASITIPNSVTSIGFRAFYECSSLTSIVVESGNTVYDSRDNCNATIETATNTLIVGCQSTIIPNSVTSIGDEAFYCSALTSLTIPNSVTSIGYEAFYGCSALTSVTIGNSVTRIRDNAFYGCSALTSVIIGNSVEYIDGLAFGGCSALADIYCYATTPPQCYEDSKYGTFIGVSKHCYIHVPAGTIRDYQMAYGWSDFYHFYEISELPDGTPTDQVGVTVTGNYATFSWPVNPTASSYTLTITKDGEVFCTLIFNNMGQLVGMAFAPARDGKPSANQSDAQSTAYGFSFVVTNLDANSHYTYTFTVNGADSEVIETYSGSFDTSEETALPATKQDNQPSRKLLRNGQVLILRNGETYDMMGQRL